MGSLLIADLRASPYLYSAPTPFEPFELIEPVSTLSSPSKGRHAPGLTLNFETLFLIWRT